MRHARHETRVAVMAMLRPRGPVGLHLERIDGRAYATCTTSPQKMNERRTNRRSLKMTRHKHKRWPRSTLYVLRNLVCTDMLQVSEAGEIGVGTE
jgi:hypothetical protein